MNSGEQLLAFRANLSRKPVIAGVRTATEAQDAKKSGVEVCFFLTGDLYELRRVVTVCKTAGQMVFAHVDLIQGVAKDPCGIQLLAEETGVDGILTTKSHLITAAKKSKLIAIQRMFMLDSEALKTAVKILEGSQPDAVEILPALILPRLRQRLPRSLPLVIGGGLVENEQDLKSVLDTGILAVSTSKKKLWEYRR